MWQCPGLAIRKMAENVSSARRRSGVTASSASDRAEEVARDEPRAVRRSERSPQQRASVRPIMARMIRQGSRDDPEFDRWRAEADRALASARVQGDAGLHNWACFAAEQSAQLATKALLHGLGQGPWGHDLVRLGELAGAAGVELPLEVLDAMRRLGRHYIPARHPDAHPSGPAAAHYGEADSAEAIRDAEAVLQAVDEAWRSL